MRSPCPYKQHSGAAKCRPAVSCFSSIARFQQAGNPLLFLTLLFAYFIDNVNQ